MSHSIPLAAAASPVASTPLAGTPLAGTPLARAAAGLDACVHCGFCLTACPTYLALEDENDSPRGRLVLMRAMLDGVIDAADPDAAAHIDRCLGCRGCETACPSGVPYGHLLEATRATMARTRPLPWIARAVLFVFARERLLRPALACARLLRASGLPRLIGRIPVPATFPFAMLASTARPKGRRTAATAPHTARDPARRLPIPDPRSPIPETVAVLTGCVMEGLFASVNRATERALDAQGYHRVPAPEQRCCGALHAHAGDDTTARALARANIATFSATGADSIVVNSAGCGAMLKDYGHLLQDDAEWRDRAAAFSARVRDISELLVAGGLVATAPAPPHDSPPVRVAYDAPCHLQHAQRITTPPLAVLAATPNVTLVSLSGSDECCGSAGIFNLVEPGVAAAVLRPKIAAIDAADVDIVATGNPGCLMQIGGGLLRAGSRTVARHPVELGIGDRG